MPSNTTSATGTQDSARRAGSRQRGSRPPLRPWLYYQFDEWVAGGFWRMVVLLGVALCAGAVLITAARFAYESWAPPVTVAAAGDASASADAADGNEPVTEALWQTVFNSLDPGVISSEPRHDLRPVMIVATLLGLLVLSTLVGLITNKMDERLAGLRRGSTPVCENDHVLILGWNSAIFDLVREIRLSSEGQRPPTIVILADRDNGEMIDSLASFVHGEVAVQAARGVPSSQRMRRPITRAGLPWDRGALARVRAAHARWILVLADEDESDAAAIKTLLALEAELEESCDDGDRPVVVSAINSHRNVSIAQQAAGERVAVVDSDVTLARMLVQTVRQAGLGAVVRGISTFAGDEFYARPVPASMVGRTLGDAVLTSARHGIIGIERRGTPGRVLGASDIPLDSVLAADDTLWIIAADDSDADALAFDPAMASTVDRALATPAPPAEKRPESVLVIGWNRRGKLVLDELDRYSAPGSEVVIFDPTQGELDRELARVAELPRRNLQHVKALAVDQDIAEWVEYFHRSMRPLSEFSYVLVLDDIDTSGAGIGADLGVARVVLELRKLRRESKGVWPRMVCEVSDDRTRELIRIHEGEEFIASASIVASLMTHFAIDPRRIAIYEDVFDADGAEIRTRALSEFLGEARSATWATVLASAMKRGEVPIGWLVPVAGGDYRVFLNPPRDGEPIDFAAGARIVVLSED